MSEQRVYHLSQKRGHVRQEEFDRSFLRADYDGYRPHRDYAAHYFRWGWATRWFLRKKAHVLDVGCGPDVPLARISVYRNRQPERLVCVDLNNLDKVKVDKWVTLYGETDFTDVEVQRMLWRNHGPFDVVVCFEVIEHMTIEKGDELLLGLQRLVKPDGYVLLSTPVFNGHRAANHIYEYGIDELREKIERAGLHVEKRYGSFMSYNDAKKGIRDYFKDEPEMQKKFRELYENLREFHSDDVLATFLAPVMPDYARNNVWKLRKVDT